MAAGGIYDQLGGGFHRYSVDDIWLVPHFEKMLYDNAQLARLYLHAWQVTGEPVYRRVVDGTLDYVLREMTDPAGGFYSAQDADSEGEEGKFFVWTPAQIEEVLAGGARGSRRADSASPPPSPRGDDVRLFFDAYGVTPQRQLRGRDDPARRRSTQRSWRRCTGSTEDEVEPRLAALRARLLAAREQRVRPGLDDKVLASWNGLMLAAFAEAARVLGDETTCRRRAPTPSSCSARCARPTAACCARGTPAGPS